MIRKEGKSVFENGRIFEFLGSPSCLRASESPKRKNLATWTGFEPARAELMRRRWL